MDLIRTIRTHNVGLDLVLGGGFRFVRRDPGGDQESATILIRGGPGTGKSVLAQDTALRLAEQIGGDVLYTCIEVLPSEIIAQRMGFDGFDPRRVQDLSRKGKRNPDASGPCLVVGMRDAESDADGVPDLGEALLTLVRIATNRGFSPKIVVVDSLSDGYHTGGNIPRATADGICKLAVEQGWGLILIEETTGPAVSPWTFAVDTVISLALSASEKDEQSTREVHITKHRFGPCEPGPHRLRVETDRIRVLPAISAYKDAFRYLDLARPATKRSMHLPPKNDQIKKIDYEDEKGHCLLVIHSHRGIAFDPQVLLKTQEGEFQRVDLLLEEESSGGTLHHLADGQGWLAGAFEQLMAIQGPIFFVSIGPVESLDYYVNRNSIKASISALANTLIQKHFLVLLWGHYPSMASIVRFKAVKESIQVNQDRNGVHISLGSTNESFSFPNK